MPRKRAERGSIARLDRNRYRIRYLGDKGDGKGYRRLSANFTGTLTEARAERDRLIATYSTDDKHNHTLMDAYYRLYLPDCEKRGLAPRTLVMYKSVWKNHVEPKFGKRLLRDIKPLEIQSHVDGLTRNQALKTITLLSSIYGIANKFEMTDRNPIVGFTIPERCEKMDDGIYRIGELLSIAEHVKGNRIEPIFLLCAFGSCRPGEARAVTLDDMEMVTAKNGMPCLLVRINKEVVDKRDVEERVKRMASERYIVVPSKWGERLLEIATERAAEGHVWLFEGRGGKPASGMTVNTAWKKSLDGSGTHPHTIRSLRPSWRTAWDYDIHIEGEKLELLMGHKPSGVSEKHYIRPDKLMLVDVVADAFVKSGYVS